MKQIGEQYKKAVEKEFEEFNQNNGRQQSTKYKLNGECGTYNNLFYVWDFRNVKFELNMDERTINAANTKLITIPHVDFQMKTKPDDHAKKKKREEKRIKKKEK